MLDIKCVNDYLENERCSVRNRKEAVMSKLEFHVICDNPKNATLKTSVKFGNRKRILTFRRDGIGWGKEEKRSSVVKKWQHNV
jgi:hypothetical protein